MNIVTYMDSNDRKTVINSKHKLDIINEKAKNGPPKKHHILIDFPW